MQYVELHCHSHWSLLDGASSVEELVLRARERGYEALALTDHDGLYGAMEFAQTARAFGVGPIIGAEVTLADGYHLTLLCETQEGYANLCRLLSHAHLNSPRGQPALDPAVLARHARGLIALSGCKKGEVPSLVAAGRYKDAEVAARRYIRIFGRDNFSIELQQNLVYGDTPRIRALVKLASRLKLGYMATFPIPEEIRLGNAIALGMKKTCPECTMDVRWINTWHDPVVEKDAAASLFDGGAQVVFTGADTPAVADVAQEKGKWGVTYDWYGSCKVDACLTAPYWNWGPVYIEISEGVRDGTYEAGWHYFDADAGAMGLFGFMEGETPQPGIADLPAEDVQLVKDTLAKMLAGEFDRFDLFSGPIVDNQGNTIVPAGEKFEYADIDQFPPGAPGLECKYCMYWWADGITAELPELE
jgi:hypothetical protein